MDINTINQNIHDGKYDDILSFIENPLNHNVEYDTDLLTAKIYGLKGNYKRALEFINTVLGDEKNDFKLIYLNLMKSNIYVVIGELQRANMMLTTYNIPSMKEKLSNEEFLQIQEFYNRVCGKLKNEECRYQDARKCLQKSLQFSKELKDTYKQCLNYFEIAVSYFHPGEMDNCEKSLQKCLKLNKEINDIYIHGKINNGLGLMNWNMRKYGQALKYSKIALQTWEKINNPLEIHKLKLNIAAIYRMYGSTEKSDKLLREALEFQIQENYFIDQVYTYWELVQLHIENNYKLSVRYTNRIQELAQLYDIEIIKLHAKIAKALILSKSINVNDKVKAKQLLNELQENHVVMDIWIYSMKINISLLIEEYIAFGREDIIQHANFLLDKIDTYYSGMTKYYYENYIYKARIKVVCGDFKGALKHLDYIISKASANKQGLLQLQAHVERLKIFEKLAEIKKIYESNIDLFNDIGDNNLNESNQNRYLENNNEIPIILFILDGGGIIRFRYEFNEILKLNPNLVASLLSAINSFAEEAFGMKSNLDRISYHDYEVIIKTENDFQYCYIYKGDTSYAEAKLSTFSKEFQLSDHFKYISNPYNIDPIPVSDATKLLIYDSFINSD